MWAYLLAKHTEPSQTFIENILSTSFFCGLTQHLSANTKNDLVFSSEYNSLYSVKFYGKVMSWVTSLILTLCWLCAGSIQLHNLFYTLFCFLIEMTPISRTSIFEATHLEVRFTKPKTLLSLSFTGPMKNTARRENFYFYSARRENFVSRPWWISIK